MMTDRQRIEQLELLIAEFAIKQDEQMAILEEHSAKIERVSLQIRRVEEVIKICLKGIQQNSDDVQFLLRKQTVFEEKLNELTFKIDGLGLRMDKIEQRMENVETKLDVVINILQNRN
ncbi:hypothetical protein DR864_01195 [Runella rosea]|uniref:Uncharacterized protein n=1 Tax=Runella rosea TaxID=2259595 RepID=A0A344TCR7_9BACT|nr:hypothetical protein [Runella rosea]AXE16438.1 hypothetical protein DR864_01195 [Runella rosea]